MSSSSGSAKWDTVHPDVDCEELYLGSGGTVSYFMVFSSVDRVVYTSLWPKRVSLVSTGCLFTVLSNVPAQC